MTDQTKQGTGADREADLPIGISLMGAVHTDRDSFDLETRFRMVRDAGVFDFVERIPGPAEIDDYIRLSDRYGLPIRSCGWFYTLQRDEPLLEWHINVCQAVGARLLNVQIRTNSAEGRPLSDRQVADFFIQASEWGAAKGVTVAFEIHVNMWSEHFGRVAAVGDLVEHGGVPFRITLDHSHVIFKIDNPEEQLVQRMKADVDSGAVILDPATAGNVCDVWIERNFVSHAHARSTIPGNPKNAAAKHPDGSYGRGIQYPFIQPRDGEWPVQWSAEGLTPWKTVMARLLRYHLTHAESPLGQITTEFIPGIDYGAGARYSILENNVACAEWLRSTWQVMRSTKETTVPKFARGCAGRSDTI